MKMEDIIDRVHCGDCLDFMRGIDACSVDTIITDPPYGLKFMGKKWDYDVPSIETWKECLRVLKPGGTALIFAGSRTQHRMAVNVEDAGFILKDCIMWIYGSGFPKATDISKQLDKGHEREQVKVDKKDMFGEYQIDGRNKNVNTTGGYQDEYVGGKVDEPNDSITAPATPEAILWNGWKSHGLKPAYEPILVAMKPNEGTYANNALKWGVSGLNIEGGRIGHNEPVKTTVRTAKRTGTALEMNTGKSDKWTEGTMASAAPAGRFPANIILDEEAGRMLDEQAPETGAFAPVKSGKDGKSNGIYGDFSQKGDDGKTFHRDGLQGASRFFYCAKASKKERNAGCEGMEERKPVGSGFGFTENPMATHDKSRSEMHGKIKNHHPTVKPLALMEYLCTLTKTPTGGIVLDPFCGSGSTCKAAKNVGRSYIGIEKDPDYCKIAEKRIQEERDKYALFND